MPIGSAIIGSAAHKFNSRPGAMWGVMEARSTLASAAAESAVSWTTLGVNDAGCSTFNGRMETGAATGEGAGAGAGVGAPPHAAAPASSAIDRNRAPARDSCPPNVR